MVAGFESDVAAGRVLWSLVRRLKETTGPLQSVTCSHIRDDLSIRSGMFPPYVTAKHWNGVDLTPYHWIIASDLRHPNIMRGIRAMNLTAEHPLPYNLALAEILRHNPNRWACSEEIGGEMMFMSKNVSGGNRLNRGTSTSWCPRPTSGC